MRESAQPSRRALLAGAALVVILLGGFAAVVVDAQRGSRRGLEDRFRLRSSLAADFVRSYLVDTARQEGAVARARLAGLTVSGREFEAAVERFQFDAAVLLESQGRVVHVYPRRPDLLGTRITPRYAHLRDALQGRLGVSDVVPSAARNVPIVAVAVPFQTLAGLRVFSGAFSVERSPIAAFLRNAIPLRLGSARLLDSRGRVIAATGERGNDLFVAATRVAPTDWRVELAAPRSALFAPIAGPTKWIPWALLACFALAAAAILVLVLRLLKSQAGLRERSDEVVRLLDVQRGFVATTAHELRTPLTSVAGFLDYLLNGKAGEVTEEQREYLEIARRNADRVQDLAADLLVAAQIDAGELELRREEITLDAVARETVESAAPAAESKGVELVLHATDGAPVLADRKRLAQVVGNLVSNAVKFTPAEGRVEVRAFRENGHSVVEVSDTGIGIPAEEQERLFQRFYRSSAALERDIPGTGLGLAISRDITELHGGRLVSAVQPASARPSASSCPRQNKTMASKILVVEDDQDIRQLLHLHLTGAGYETAFARDAATALAVARKEQPDLVVLDLGLPAGDGFVVMERLRSLPDFEMLPIVVITARDASEGERAVSLGAVRFFQKPFDADELIGEIRRALGQ